MTREVDPLMAAHLGSGALTTCCLLKLIPDATSGLPAVGLTNLDDDVPFDDGRGEGVTVYRSEHGFNLFNLSTSMDGGVDNTEAHCLAAAVTMDGVTAENVRRGNYDNASFRLYLVNYMDTTIKPVILQTGRVGDITVENKQNIVIELRSLTTVLRQKSLIELTSITDRAKYGDERNKMPLYWYNSSVATLGAESDRAFTLGSIYHQITDVPQMVGDGSTDTFQLIDDNGQPVTTGFDIALVKGNGVSLAYTVDAVGFVTLNASPADGVQVTVTAKLYVGGVNDYFVPGLVHWLSGENAGRENEIEDFTVTGGVSSVVLAIPTRTDITVGDTLMFRRDSDKSKARAIQDNNLANFRGEPELPRGDGIDQQAPGA